MIQTLNNIFEYSKCTSSSRKVIEGEKIINSNQIILFETIQLVNVNGE